MNSEEIDQLLTDTRNSVNEAGANVMIIAITKDGRQLFKSNIPTARARVALLAHLCVVEVDHLEGHPGPNLEHCH